MNLNFVEFFVPPRLSIFNGAHATVCVGWTNGLGEEFSCRDSPHIKHFQQRAEIK